jgi:hypothetical protein
MTKTVGDVRPIGDTRPKTREENQRTAKNRKGKQRVAKESEEKSVD